MHTPPPPSNSSKSFTFSYSFLSSQIEHLHKLDLMIIGGICHPIIYCKIKVELTMFMLWTIRGCGPNNAYMSAYELHTE